MTSRKSLTLSAKVAAFIENALCPASFKPYAGDVQFDHFDPLAISGKDHDEQVLVPLHKACHAIKTKRDRKAIAKTNRIIRKAEGTWRPNKKKIQSRNTLSKEHRKAVRERMERDGQ